METGKTLIDTASAKCGGLRRLADTLHESSSYLSNVRTGKKPISPGLAARVAVVAGIDARRAALEAVVSQEKDREKQVALALAFGVEIPQELTPPSTGLLHKMAYKLNPIAKAARRLFRRSAEFALASLPA